MWIYKISVCWFIYVHCCRATQKELAAIASLVEHNVKRAQESSECLDLDEMFSFLSDVQETKPNIQEFVSEIGQQMEALLQDAEDEVFINNSVQLKFYYFILLHENYFLILSFSEQNLITIFLSSMQTDNSLFVISFNFFISCILIFETFMLPNPAKAFFFWTIATFIFYMYELEQCFYIKRKCFGLYYFLLIFLYLVVF